MEKTDQEFDKYRNNYHTLINAAIAFTGKPVEYFTKVKADYLLDLLGAETAETLAIKVLDVGCGHGDIHPFLIKGSRAIELSGIDIASSVVDVARSRLPEVSYQTYDGRRLPFPDGFFDAAFTIGVVHHVPPPQWDNFIKEMQRVVRPGGLIVVFEHNPLNPITRRLVNNCPIDENAHLVRETVLSRLMRANGLEALRSRYIIFTPFSQPIFRLLDRWLGWLPLGAQYYVAGRVAERPVPPSVATRSASAAK